MTKPLSMAIACILLAYAAAPAHAQTQPASPLPADDTDEQDNRKATDLDNVIVTGSRSPKAIDKIPGAITVVNTEEVKHTLAVTEDATAVLARSVPGYAESTQAMSNTGENLRGRIALRLFDGVPQGSPLREGTRNGTFTDMGIVGRIEVINGPSASEGIGAAGGIINYISAAPTKEGSETTITSRYSSQFGDDSEGWKLGVNYALKQENHDLLLAASHIERGISYDGNGRRIGMNTSGSVSDSKANNLFLKGGFYFGEEGMQRLEASYSHFRIAGNGNYHQVEGCRFDPVTCPVPTTNTSERGGIAGSLAEFNDFTQYQLNYIHNDMWGGTLNLSLYAADQAMRYLPENGDDKQLVKVDANFNEADRIYDQSEIDSKKKGLRSAWTRPSLFGVPDLELRIGLDIVRDEAQQRLALTDRVWVPPMEYESVAPWMQLSWDIGPVTLSGGYRHQDDELHVDSYTTSAFRNSVFVEGGGVEYKENLVNYGAVWRFAEGWSAFASYGEGFGLPNIGIPLRNISAPGQSVDRIKDLGALIVENVEYGINWRGEHGAVGVSRYESRTDFGASLSIDPVTNDFLLTRAPNKINGYELSAEYRFTDALKASAVYARSEGWTSFYPAAADGSYPAGELLKPMGILDVSPNKLSASMTWKFLPQADVTLGATKWFSRDLSGSGYNRPGATPPTIDYAEHTDGYTLYDLGVNYETRRFGKFTLGVENLLDKQYILAWAQVPGFQNYWAGRGRMVSLTHTFKF